MTKSTEMEKWLENIDNDIVARTTDHLFTEKMSLGQKYFYLFLIGKYKDEFASKFAFRRSKSLDKDEMQKCIDTREGIKAIRKDDWGIYKEPARIGGHFHFFFKDIETVYTEIFDETARTLKYISGLSILKQEERNFFVHLIEKFEGDIDQAAEIFEDKEKRSIGVENQNKA